MLVPMTGHPCAASLTERNNPMDQHDRKAWRKGSVYAADFRPLDRNQRAKILFLAEAMDRRTHKGSPHDLSKIVR